MAATIAQTIAIVDRSGKVVSSSKQLKNVFLEAKLAYQERKAEIKAERKDKEDRELRKAIKAMSIYDEDDRSGVSGSRTRVQGHGHRGDTESRQRRAGDSILRPDLERHRSSWSARSCYSGATSPSSAPSQRSPARPALSREGSSSQHQPQLEELEHGYYSPTATGYSTPTSPRSAVPSRLSTELVRRRTELELPPPKPPRPGSLLRTSTSPSLAHDDGIDMDLAYGEFHPDSLPLVSRSSPDLARTSTSPDQQIAQQRDREELSSLVVKCKMLLDEANCAQHSVKAVMTHLQQNPDAMAAVALTLAEISNIASKMAPGVLTGMKALAPTVFGLLAAPEFLIAVGVGVGLTVVMFGGYKIVKRIQAKMEGNEDNGMMRGGRGRRMSMDEAIDVEELSHIEHWRRGIADSQFDRQTETGSVVSAATSVEGEFITPNAARSLGHLPLPKDRKKGKDGKGEGEIKKRRKRHGSSSVAQTESGSGSKVSEKEKRGKEVVVKVKKPSPLRRMFRGEGSSIAS